MSFVHKLFSRFRFAILGIVHAVRHDSSFRLQFIFGFIFLVVFWFLTHPLTKLETSSLVFAWLLVLITELQNSAFESALDRIHPDHHEDIGRSKDMAAGAVLIAGFFALFIVVSIVLARI